MDLIPKNAYESTVLDGKYEVLDRPGNCIAAAVYDLIGASAQAKLLSHLQNTELPANVVAAKLCVRSYAEVQGLTDVSMVPCKGFNLSRPGKYILHIEAWGRPHCLSVQVQYRDANLHCEVIDGNNQWLMPLNDLIACAAMAVEKDTIVTYKVFLPGQVAVWPDKTPKEVLSILLNLQAGVRGVPHRARASTMSQDMAIDLDGGSGSDCDSADDFFGNVEDDDDESIVNVGDELMRLMQQEVDDAIEMISSCQRRKLSSVFACSLCPFRQFGRKAALLDHLRVHKSPGHQCVCSGTKQLKIALALYDNDQLSGRTSCAYIRRSAEELQRTVIPSLDINHNNIDKTTRTPRNYKIKSIHLIKDLTCSPRSSLSHTSSPAALFLSKREQLFSSSVSCMCGLQHSCCPFFPWPASAPDKV